MISPQTEVSPVSTPAALPQASCPRCGFAIEPGDMFCHNCGDKVREGKPVAGARRPKKSFSLWATTALFIGIISMLALIFQKTAPTVLLGLLAIASGVIGFRKVASDSWKLAGRFRAALGMLLGAAAIALLVLHGMGVLKLA